MTAQYFLVQGASRGIGLAMVAYLLARDDVAHVYACSRTPNDSQPLQDLLAAHPSRLTLVPLDITREADIAHAAAMIKDRHGCLHGLINCAGLLHDASLQPEKRLEQIDVAALDASFRVNAFGPMLLARHFFALLKHDQPARFVTLSARVGSISDNAMGGWYSYRASKAAQNQFTRTFAIEARRRAKQLIILALHPGTTDTALSQPFQKNVPDKKLFTTAFVAETLLNIVFNATAEDSGRFIAWDGQDIPW
ncbi:MAG: SDR family NAD(P)-dependent oxidoreductase [Alcanivorax sp.]|nr:SDR family NAD(P)-dependent oxidoreductase [Alcanivorax sp.]